MKALKKRDGVAGAAEITVEATGRKPRRPPYLSLLAGALAGLFCVLLVLFLLPERVPVPAASRPVDEPAVPVAQKPHPAASAEPSGAVSRTVESATPTSPPVAAATVQAPQPLEDASDMNRPSSVPPLPEALSLVVSEIYFQEAAGGSMAIINDLPVMEGTTIENALAERIFPDRVLFLVNGQRYEARPVTARP